MGLKTLAEFISISCQNRLSNIIYFFNICFVSLGLLFWTWFLLKIHFLKLFCLQMQMTRVCILKKRLCCEVWKRADHATIKQSINYMFPKGRSTSRTRLFNQLHTRQYRGQNQSHFGQTKQSQRAERAAPRNPLAIIDSVSYTVFENQHQAHKRRV